MSEIEFSKVFGEISSAAELSPQTARQAFDAILAGGWTPAQVAGFVVALRLRGESAAVIAAAASSMRATMIEVKHSFDLVLDTCGTGGDGMGTVNLSTGAAIIAAAAGVPIAKHGNRAISSRAGSADVLAALGIATDLSAAQATAVFEQARITFLLAPTHHPAMRHAMAARKELGIRTIFNCLGPLSNPAKATHQVVGAFSDELRPVMAETLGKLGVTRAWVVRGNDGLDEMSPYTGTRISEYEHGRVREFELSPQDFGLELSPANAAQGGSATENAAIITAVLSNEAHPSRDAFILNAAAALVVAQGIDPKAAAGRVRGLLETGAALKTLQRWRDAVTACRSEGELVS